MNSRIKRYKNLYDKGKLDFNKFINFLSYTQCDSDNREIEEATNYLMDHAKCYIAILSLKGFFTDEPLADVYGKIIERLDLLDRKISVEKKNLSFEGAAIVSDLLLSYYYISKRKLEMIQNYQPREKLHELIRSLDFNNIKIFMAAYNDVMNYMVEEIDDTAFLDILKDVLLSDYHQYATWITYRMKYSVSEKKSENQDTSSDFTEEETMPDEDEDIDDEENGRYDYGLDGKADCGGHGFETKSEEQKDRIFSNIRLMAENKLWEAVQVFQRYAGGMDVVFAALDTSEGKLCQSLRDEGTVDSLRLEFEICKQKRQKPDIYSTQKVRFQSYIDFIQGYRRGFLTGRDGRWSIKENSGNITRWMILYLLNKELTFRCRLEPDEPLNEEILQLLEEMPPVDFGALEKPSRPAKLFAKTFNVFLKEGKFSNLILLIDTMGRNNLFYYDENEMNPYFGSYNDLQIQQATREVVKKLDYIEGGKRLSRDSIMKLYMTTHIKCFVHLPCFLSWFFSNACNISVDPKCLECSRDMISSECRMDKIHDGVQFKNSNDLFKRIHIFGEYEGIDGKGEITVKTTNIRKTNIPVPYHDIEQSIFFKNLDLKLLNKEAGIIQPGDPVMLEFLRYRCDSKLIQVRDIILMDKKKNAVIIEKEKKHYEELIELLTIIREKGCFTCVDEQRLLNSKVLGHCQVTSEGYGELFDIFKKLNWEIYKTVNELCQKEPESVISFLKALGTNNFWSWNNPYLKDNYRANYFNLNVKANSPDAADNANDLSRLRTEKALKARNFLLRSKDRISAGDFIEIYMNSHLRSLIFFEKFLDDLILNYCPKRDSRYDLKPYFDSYSFYGSYVHRTEEGDLEFVLTSASNRNLTVICSKDESDQLKGKEKAYRFNLKELLYIKTEKDKYAKHILIVDNIS